jgi:hypothetical protein
VLWTAPSATIRLKADTTSSLTRIVVFNIAANGANGDERADGDYVYTLTRETSGSKVPGFQGSKVVH